MVRILLVFWMVITLVVYRSQGQPVECLTTQMDSIRRKQQPGLGTIADFEGWMTKSKNEFAARTQNRIIYRIPVVVHVVHNGEPVGEGPNIGYEQVLSQIEVLNEDFRRKEGTNGFNDNPVGADTDIEFFLAEFDPDGNPMPEPGVDRVDGGLAEWPKGIFRNPIETELKPSTIWDPDSYFNIWTVNFGGFAGRFLLGYAQFPDMSGLEGLEEDEGSTETDGVVVGYKYFGSSEKGDFPDLIAPFDLGRTTTHEVGHWLGLRHIWGDGDCTVDDFVRDTPRMSEATSGCPPDPVSCSIIPMIENHMDYSDDFCKNIFTEGQKERMLTVLQNSPRRVGVAEEFVLDSQRNAAVDFSLFPNPLLGDLYLRLEGITGDIQLKILDSTGKVRWLESRQISSTKYLWQVKDLGLPPGLYFVNVESLQHSIARKQKLFVL